MTLERLHTNIDCITMYNFPLPLMLSQHVREKSIESDEYFISCFNYTVTLFNTDNNLN